MRSPIRRPRTPRRGLTLIEMLVSVALLVLMMTVIVLIFQAATGAITVSRSFQELDGRLRQLDSTIRSDLRGVTARFTPPLNPRDNLGYFEYGENAFADLQGEDVDDYIRFTAKAPEGQPFTGRVWVAATSWPNPTPPPNFFNNLSIQPVLVTSDYAEIIYFLRNGNLYRRVLLIAPERQSAVNQSNFPNIRAPSFGNLYVSWQGVNDLSARPNSLGTVTSPIILNTLGDLTNRENRAFSPRFCWDFNTPGDAAGTINPDGLIDDLNVDGVPDYYPTLYPNMIGTPLDTESQIVGFPLPALRNANAAGANNYNIFAFPFIFPGAYSRPDPNTSGVGWIHSPDPLSSTATLGASTFVYNFNSDNYNMGPLDLGDSLPIPAGTQTWWGFPTRAETVSPNWTDPYKQLNTALPAATANTIVPPAGDPGTGVQSWGLQPFNPSTLPAATYTNYLLPLTTPPFLQLFNDGAGGIFVAGGVNYQTFDAVNSNVAAGNPAAATVNPLAIGHDDLIMTGVRSFDVKAYDNAFAGYVDLGWGDDGKLYLPYAANPSPPYLYTTGNPPVPLPYLQPVAGVTTITWPPLTTGTVFNLVGQTYAHEGRIPPLVVDNRVDPQYPTIGGVANNIGEISATTIRLRRVWDTWSTDYTNAPATGINPTTQQPVGPPFNPPLYPSYPAPYPMPLRGIQIQVRVVDPQNQRVKVLTIKQDFSDKL